MIQKIVEGCPCLLYLNLSCTLITNKTLQELSRNCLNLQYLSLAYCYGFTDKGFMYLTTGKGCHNLFHLNLSGCTQMTVNGFRYISAGCPSLKEIVINDMPTLSDSCVLVSFHQHITDFAQGQHRSSRKFKRKTEEFALSTCIFVAAKKSLTLLLQALIARCPCLSAISLLNARHLSDVAFKAIAEVAKLKTFSTEGNNRLTDISWIALCRSSQGLSRIHAAECPRMTDASLKSAAALKNLQHLDISLCSKVSDTGIKYLTEGFSSTKLRELNGLAALERIGLKKLVLSECVYITDIGIEMTDMAVQYLTSGSQYLRELDVSGCVLLTDRSLRHLEKICPPFCSITMAFCSSISKGAALKLQPRVKYWEHSNDDPPYWFGCQTHAVTRSTRTDDTWEMAERHSAMT
ncbi:F-box/LRR-repeat protein 13 F-box and leucine-rich repeat protein 13 [Collichthys lucidus]|uniref:F-box/LRR-repeat protein 13 F-box and leucine-rich repeat protein 13 n=1 Tax=Collichthys lucidus TaxID=240159 RepID=A0A4U5UF62_COLLU|nr:F-box/LRR-repeat protein 13 F-box and leucine-rich repeat protein 13 [Collichthys lucidus]